VAMPKFIGTVESGPPLSPLPQCLRLSLVGRDVPHWPTRQPPERPDAIAVAPSDVEPLVHEHAKAGQHVSSKG